MFKVINKNIYVNHGDAMTLTLVNNTDSFVGPSTTEQGGTVEPDQLKFSICERGNYNKMLFQHTFTVQQTAVQVDLEFQNEIMEELWASIPNPSNNEKIYVYEIELANHNATLVGRDKKGDKLFIVYPEITDEEASI